MREKAFIPLKLTRIFPLALLSVLIGFPRLVPGQAAPVEVAHTAQNLVYIQGVGVPPTALIWPSASLV